MSKFRKNKSVLENIILELKENIRKISTTSNEIPKFAFICGRQVFDEDGNYKSEEILVNEKNKRHFLMKQFESLSKMGKYGYRNVVSVISEKLYQNEEIDILTFEELLAEISDDIIIIVESMGTACELGAFTIKNRYIDKVTVINQKKHAQDKSFLNDGPIKKIKSIDDGQRVIIVKNSYYMNKGSKDFRDFVERTIGKEVDIIPNKDENNILLKSMIYELLNLIELFGPLYQNDLFELYKYFKGFSHYKLKDRDKHKINTSSQIIELMKNMGLISVTDKCISISPNITCYNAMFTISQDSFQRYRLKAFCKPSSKHYIIQAIINEDNDKTNSERCN
ncbi:retron St85 family effector protein [Clostridium butyricum]|uniref:retron St85 family effector protein n=1 Tax=Clostridium butyricum TaxID=1492 RepID=UPI003466C87C